MRRGRFIAPAAIALGAMAVAFATCDTRAPLPVLSWSEYVALRTPTPYILSLPTPQGRLVYFGCRHTFDPDNPQIGQILRVWNASRPDVALCEGGPLPAAKDAREAVSRHGEVGLVWFLARRAGVPVYGLDPPTGTQVRYLMTFFPPDEIKMYYVLLLAVLLREQKGLDIEARQIREILDSCAGLGCLGAPGDVRDFESGLPELNLRRETWRSEAGGIFHDRAAPGNYVAAIHERLTSYRDQAMMRRIIEEMAKGGTVFVLAGKSHTAIQEPALRAAAKVRAPGARPRKTT